MAEEFIGDVSKRLAEDIAGAAFKDIAPARVPILVRLRRMKAAKEEELNDIDAAIKVLESNPGFVEALDVLGRVSNRIY